MYNVKIVGVAVTIRILLLQIRLLLNRPDCCIQFRLGWCFVVFSYTLVHICFNDV